MNFLILIPFLLGICLSSPIKTEKRDGVYSPNTTANSMEAGYGKPYAVFRPQIFIVSLFELEREPWVKTLDFKHNITIPGLSPLYPEIYCTTNYTICHVTTGEGEINAASTITALGLSPLFDLSKTYWLVAGIAGGVPEYTTIGGVTFAKYAVQAGLAYEIDWREIEGTNPEWNSSYFALGTKNPSSYPVNIYGTEVFELNENLRDRALELASKAKLDNGTHQNAKFRALYPQKAAKSLPAVAACDVLTSDVYYTGNYLNDYFANYSKIITNNTAKYCTSAQEDNASLEAFVRLDKFGLADYKRIVVMRTVSDFVTPPPSMANNTVEFFTNNTQGGIEASLNNLVHAGLPFVHDILDKWDSVYKEGKKYQPKNYIGDFFRTLGGKPDFGSPNYQIA